MKRAGSVGMGSNGSRKPARIGKCALLYQNKVLYEAAGRIFSYVKLGDRIFIAHETFETSVPYHRGLVAIDMNGSEIWRTQGFPNKRDSEVYGVFIVDGVLKASVGLWEVTVDTATGELSDFVQVEK